MSSEVPEGVHSTAPSTTTANSDETSSSGEVSSLKVVPLRSPVRYVSWALAAIVVAMFVHTLFSTTTRFGQDGMQPRFEWHIVFQYLFDRVFVYGAIVTVILTATSMIVGVAIGIGLAAMRLSKFGVFRVSAALYVWFFRGTPVWTQLIFWVNLAYLYPIISVGLPFGSTWHSWSMSGFETNFFLVAIIALGLNEGAYMAEIVRGGILVVDHGQVEAASSLGMRRALAFRRIILPQAMRSIIPPTGNETISMLKTTSLVAPALGAISILGITTGDINEAAVNILSRNYHTIPVLMVAALWYLFLTSVLSIVQYFIERHYGRGFVSTSHRRERRSLRTALEESPR